MSSVPVSATFDPWLILPYLIRDWTSRFGSSVTPTGPTASYHSVRRTPSSLKPAPAAGADLRSAKPHFAYGTLCIPVARVFPVCLGLGFRVGLGAGVTVISKKMSTMNAMSPNWDTYTHLDVSETLRPARWVIC